MKDREERPAGPFLQRRWGGIVGSRIWATVLLVAGAVLVLLSLLADVIGLGTQPIFGWKQTAALVVGLVLIGVGWLVRR